MMKGAIWQMRDGCLEDNIPLPILVWHSTNRASGNKLMHCNPRQDDGGPRHPLQRLSLKSWGKHGHDEINTLFDDVFATRLSLIL